MGRGRPTGRRRRSRRLVAAVASLLGLAAIGAGLTLTSSTDQRELAPPSNVTARALSPTSVELDWNGSEDVDSYVVKVGNDHALSTATTTTVPPAGNTATLSDLSAGNSGGVQFYRVDAVRDGEVRSSRTGRVTLMPGVIAKLSVIAKTAGGVKVAWQKAANARQFDVTIARNKSFTDKATTVRTLDDHTTFVTNGLRSATDYWLKVRPVNGERLGEFTAPVAFTTSVRESSFRVGSWNVCSEKCSGYAGRAQIMADFLNANRIDIFGLQESGGVRIGAVTNAIFSGHSQNYVRADGGAKARYIFYRPALFTQLDGGSFGVGDGRNTTWAAFKVRATKRVFYYVDVHLENGKGADAKRTREMTVMLRQMAQINDTGKPMIYAGDFNSGRHRKKDTPGLMMRTAGFEDSYLATKDTENGEINTGHTFSTKVLRSGAQIDHIWISPEFDVESWAQLVRITDGKYTKPVVSDHNAVSAVVALDATKKSVGEPTATTPIAGPATPIG